MDRKTKSKIVLEAREYFRAHFPDVDPKAGCMFMAFCVLKIAHKYGVNLVPQAGSAHWRRVTKEQDDGVCNTHFSYVWEPDNPQTMMRLSMGLLPELHVWCGDPETQEIVDITTGNLPEQCEELTGMDWPAPRPPDFIWCNTRDSDAVAYEVDELATHIVVSIMREAI